uniref:Cyclin N-terminal domain-containing protein n=1 Tax=Cyclophora tenuis TaxID=216820 RepID=A0A6U1QAG3_CYCTE|mmetsp:Transcript_17853/g.30373  ORF Transcript_17853/g.30373 Transcript_17853/m.30373 type:complete len:247 (+) Transcript_17853:296-1036(+)
MILPHAFDLADVKSAMEGMCVQQMAYQCKYYLKDSKQASKRRSMLLSCFHTLDDCRFTLETLEIAASIVDRYFASKDGTDLASKADSSVIRLVYMTGLYTAIKVAEPSCVSPYMVRLWAGRQFSEDEVTAMESRMLQAIGWRVSNPTVTAFVQHCMALLTDEFLVVPEDKTDFETIATYQAALSVLDHSLLNVEPSVIGLAAVKNALGEDVDYAADYITMVGDLLRIDPWSEEMEQTQSKLEKCEA